jgi:hypothetical protein
VVVAWANLPIFSQFTAAGRWLHDLQIGNIYATYRAFRMPWAARPAHRPRVAARRQHRARKTTVYASWNGATEHVAWAVHAGTRRSHLRPVARARRTGFETAIEIPLTAGYVQATALDRAGRALGRSEPVRL